MMIPEYAQSKEQLLAQLSTWRDALPFSDGYHRQIITDAIRVIETGELARADAHDLTAKGLSDRNLRANDQSWD